MLDKNYYYELKYVNGDESLTFKFPASIDVWDLTLKLRDFLCGCSWSEDVVKSILRLEDEDKEDE